MTLTGSRSHRFPADAYADVPQPDPTAEVDPHWLELRSGATKLPEIYMPPAMAGARSPLVRAMALFLIGIFVLATSLGICLTYGPPGGLL